MGSDLELMQKVVDELPEALVGPFTNLIDEVSQRREMVASAIDTLIKLRECLEDATLEINSLRFDRDCLQKELDEVR